MNWVDKLNHWALKAIRRQAVKRIEITSDGAQIVRSDDSHLLRWSEVQEVAIVMQPQLSAGSYALVIRVADSSVTIVDDTVLGYSELIQEMSRQLPNIVPYSNWAIGLAASPQDPGQVIFRRAGDVSI
jgi:hypothetical protein